MKRLSALMAIATFAFASQAFAIVEARLTYGGLLSTPDLGGLVNSGVTAPSAAANYGVGGDLLVFIPLTGFGVGVRYENLSMSASSGSVSANSTAGRTAAIVTYRFIDTILHLGLLGTYGMGHSNSISLDDTGHGTSYKWAPDTSSSYSLGVDCNVSLIAFLVGAEAGYESMKWNHLTDSTGTSTKTPDLDMSGTYAKVYIGLGF